MSLQLSINDANDNCLIELYLETTNLVRKNSLACYSQWN